MIKTFLASLLTLTFALADAHILVYHRFDDPRHVSTDISIQNLRAQFEYFKNNGYEVVKLSRLVDAVMLASRSLITGLLSPLMMDTKAFTITLLAYLKSITTHLL